MGRMFHNFGPAREKALAIHTVILRFDQKVRPCVRNNNQRLQTFRSQVPYTFVHDKTNLENDALSYFQPVYIHEQMLDRFPIILKLTKDQSDCRILPRLQHVYFI